MIHLLTTLILIGLALLPTWSAVLPAPSGAAAQPPTASEAPVIPATMHLVSQLGGDIHAVATSTPYIYTGNGPRVTMYYALRPGPPSQLQQSEPLPQVVEDIAATATDVLFVAIGQAGLQIMFADLPDLLMLGSVDTPGTALGVAATSGYAYVADSASGVQVVDARDLSAPVLVGSLATSGTPVDVAARNGLLYIADGMGLSIASLANPAQPVLLSPPHQGPPDLSRH